MGRTWVPKNSGSMVFPIDRETVVWVGGDSRDLLFMQIWLTSHDRSASSKLRSRQRKWPCTRQRWARASKSCWYLFCIIGILTAGLFRDANRQNSIIYMFTRLRGHKGAVTDFAAISSLLRDSYAPNEWQPTNNASEHQIIRTQGTRQGMETFHYLHNYSLNEI